MPAEWATDPFPGGSVAQLLRALLASWSFLSGALEILQCAAYTAAFGSLARNAAYGLNGVHAPFPHHLL